MIPEPSLWGMTVSNAGFVIPGHAPARAFTSDGLTPERIKRTKTCPNVGVGIGMLIDFKTSLAVPKAEYPMAFM